jgi:hypothetical protein
MSEYHNLCVNHQRYAAGLETGDPQSLHIHAMKCTTDALILDKTLLGDVVKFCETAACGLMTGIFLLNLHPLFMKNESI